MTVSSRVWCSETIPAGFVDASLFHYVLPFLFREGWFVVNKVKYIYCCVTSVEFICAVPLYLRMDTSETKR